MLQPSLYQRHLGQLRADDFRTPTTCLFGSEEQLTALIERMRQQTGHTRFRDAWPDLLGVLIQRSPGAGPLSEPLATALSGPVVSVEIVAGPLGVFAVENVRRGGLRLLPDCGVYHELIGADDRTKTPPPRCGLAEAERGRVYELVVTTPAGLWACRTGIGVSFDGSEPARVRFVPLPALPSPEAVPVVPQTPASSKVPRPSPAQAIAPPVPMLRFPWSTPVER